MAMKRYLILVAALSVTLFWVGNLVGDISNIQISLPHQELQNEEQVFYCPTDENVILATWRDFRLGFRRCAIGRSTDGGATWSDHLNNRLLSSGGFQSDPAMTVDRQGNFYCCYMDWTENSYLIVIKSTDKGDYWEGPYVAHSAPPDHFADKEFFTCDRTNGPYDGYIYVTWTDFWGEYDSSAVGFVRSTDGGVTYGDRFDVSPPMRGVRDGSRFVGNDMFSQPIVGSDGELYIFYSGYDGTLEECDSSASMYMSKSTDGGLTWPIIRESIYDFSVLRSLVVDGNIDIFCCPAGDADTMALQLHLG